MVLGVPTATTAAVGVVAATTLPRAPGVSAGALLRALGRSDRADAAAGCRHPAPPCDPDARGSSDLGAHCRRTGPSAMAGRAVEARNRRARSHSRCRHFGLDGAERLPHHGRPDAEAA